MFLKTEKKKEEPFGMRIRGQPTRVTNQRTG